MQTQTLDLDDDEVRSLTVQLYESFETGETFETFLKLLLTEMGLEDVAVTRRTRDGGIDLTAMRVGLEELSHVDQVKYVAQAKRYTPDRSVPIEAVRALRGVMNPNEKGLFITTARFSSDARSFALQDPSRPLILIDGKRLVHLCIEHKIAFKFRPVFDQPLLLSQMGRLMTPADTQSGTPMVTGSPMPTDAVTFLKTVTTNDIRARIISLPWELGPLVGDKPTLDVEFPPHFPMRSYQYRSDRRYISGVTDVFRRFGLLGPADERVSRQAQWSFDPTTRTARVVFAAAESA